MPPIPQRKIASWPAHRIGHAPAGVHAEFIKLSVSRKYGRPVDRPEAVWTRYGGVKKPSAYAFWWPHAHIRSMDAGCRLVVALPQAGIVHLGSRRWREVKISKRSIQALASGWPNLTVST